MSLSCGVLTNGVTEPMSVKVTAINQSHLGYNGLTKEGHNTALKLNPFYTSQ